ncbi:M48 family metallopeptidase [Flavobacterium sp. PL002]|uniref:tetratricopeptide repeat protein n=1 Tax=Flavobacterium sp. PL002 TaxID=1897058 RepID=UPI001787F3B8|nr:hypothetical protein [Flavobacterium sp. PL002]MBE0390432.1 hypothetical protein [Flavobacterium sp. PL002]
MKTTTILTLIVFILFSHEITAQSNAELNNNDKELSDPISKDKKIKHYHVKEQINMRFGGSVTTYNVSDIRLISNNDLGPDNKRVVYIQYTDGTKAEYIIKSKKPALKHIDPRNTAIALNKPNKPSIIKENTIVKEQKATLFKKSNPVLTIIKDEPKKRIINNNSTSIVIDNKNIKLSKEEDEKKLNEMIYSSIEVSTAKDNKIEDSSAPKKKNYYAYINVIKTYEKVAEKGYKSVSLFKKLGDNFYFNNEMDKAARWYKELFAMNEDLDIELYYRYSNALKAVGQEENAKNLMKKFNQLIAKN